MTEKRFTIEPTMIRECIVDNTTGEQLDTFDYTERLCAMLNELAEENKEFKAMCEEYRKLSIQYKQKYDEKISDNTFLEEENKELQERNNRQCKQLDDLFRLIEEKDWRSLSDIMDDFKKSEKQLQSEWQTYEDKND